jgi:virginiamycin B lyase
MLAKETGVIVVHPTELLEGIMGASDGGREPNWYRALGVAAAVATIIGLFVGVFALFHQGGGASSTPPDPTATFTSVIPSPTPTTGLPHLTFTSIIASTESGSSAGGLVAGPDKAVWFTEYQANKIGKLLVPDGRVESELAIQKAVGPASIAAGSDGNLWFAEITSRSIGRMTPGGTYTDFPLPSGSGVPDDIVAGKDGNLWFLETGGRIVAMSTSGNIVHSYQYSGASTYLDNLLQGDDGNLWFSVGLDTLVRMTPGGIFTPFAVTCSAGLANGPSSIGGPNDSIWFREGCARNVVGRISYSGSGLREFTFPGQSDPGDIVKGSDGNMWLTSNYHQEGRIERCSPSGQIDEFKLSTTTTYAGLGNIISGPDGNLWFSIGGNGIGRFVP